MRTTITIPITVAFILLLSSCISHSYLNKPMYYHHNPKGAYFNVIVEKYDEVLNKYTKSNIGGELIYVDSTKWYLLAKPPNEVRIQTIELKDITKYNIRWAVAANYVISIPLVTALSLSHGYFVLISTPINLLYTTFLAFVAGADYRLNNTIVPIDEVYKYARFPQGLPEGVNIQDLTTEKAKH